MERRQFLLLSALASGVSVWNPARAFDLGKMLDAGKDILEAQSLSDSDLNIYFKQISEQEDKQNKIAGASSKYGKRLSKLTKGLNQYNGLKLNFKAYETPEINAFAVADGSIRIYSGLMDQFTDDEVRYVVGHEIGHVQAGHSKARIQMALRTSAFRKAIAATDGKAARLAESQLGELFESVIKAQHSQNNEREADDRAMQFMRTKQYNPLACVSALEKLDAMNSGGGASWLSTHPSPKERAQRMREQLAVS
ncbi:MAG: M48 family metallopeptidase [Zoogloeaceae bacterium]|jgi:putative metalloprotease|nr:M48 family metallopeptidase [Zoogloeaceae bacterium]